MKRTKENIFHDKNVEQLAKFAKALAHPVRIEILKQLESEACCFTGDLVDVFPLAQSTISQHLKELKNAGLIQGEVDPPKIKYCINRENWMKAKKLFNDFFSTDNLPVCDNEEC
jgi:predicted transcriptional regulator